MKYLIKRTDNYYFCRRLPRKYRNEHSKIVKFSLQTDSKRQALMLSILHNDILEAYLLNLSKAAKDFNVREYLKFSHTLLVDHILQHRYPTISSVFHDQSVEQNTTILFPIKKKTSSLKIKSALPLFWKLSKDRTMNKTPNQLRKYKVPRLRAIENFIAVVGNKSVTEISRNDVMQFRDWWVDRIEKEELSRNTANKDISHLKSILEVLDENLQLGLEIPFLFRKLMFKDRFSKRRPSFETVFLKTVFLLEKNYTDLPEQAKWALYAAAETGARLSEIIGLLPEDILLSDPIPHIHICDRPSKPLKTPYSDRKIPLVGFALDAFQRFPLGFNLYNDKSDSLSTMLNKYLREKGFLPSEKHSVYSLRHSFQDRILAANAPDRLQADLMGHSFTRPVYGEGASLAHKLKLLKSIQLKNDPC